MSDYLNNLVSRTIGQRPSILPRLASLYESAGGPPIRTAELLAAKRSGPPRSVSLRNEDRTTASRPVEDGANLSPVYRSTESSRDLVESSAARSDHRPRVTHVSDSLTEPSMQAVSSNPPVSPNTESKLEPRAPARAPAESNRGQRPVEPASDERAYRAELEAEVESPEATVLERTVVVEAPALAPFQQPLVEAVTRRDHPKTHPRSAVIVRPDLTGSYEPPTPSIEATAITREAPSAIRITIGRVDVRAIMPQAPLAAPARETNRGSALSLDEYLKKRNGA